ncbi:MAG: phosphoglycerate dehydrogenase [Opitutales bacterium]
MKILVADRISPIGVAYLKDQEGFDVVEAYGSSPEKILELASDAAAIIVRSETKVTPEVFAAAPKLKAVGRAGVGVDNIDLDAATEHGVVVMNTPGGNTVATAELTFSHMICGARPISQASASMRAGQWGRKEFPGTELRAKTLAILGLGRIGQEVAKRAKAFQMTVIAYDPYLTDARAKDLGIEKVELDQAFEQADYITVHMPMTPQTKHMVDEAAFAKMKDGVRVFNVARGGIIKEEALLEALKSGKCAAAGLDVFEVEPLAEDHPFRSMDNVVLTPHLGASTKEAQESVGIEIAEVISATLKTGVISNAVNMPSVDARTLEQIRPYLALGSSLATFVQQLAHHSVEELKVTYFGKVVDLDALPITRAIQRGFLSEISSSVNEVNATAKFEAMGVKLTVTKDSGECDYTELIQIEAFSDGELLASAAGTLIGKSNRPRIVLIDGRKLEVDPASTLLCMQNEDVPGMVGFLGTVLGEEKVNIANMSLAREGEGTAVSVFEVDSDPSEAALERIKSHSAVRKVRIVHL